MDNYLKEFIEEYHLSNEGNMTWGEVHQFQMAMKMGTEMYSGYVYRTYVFSKMDEEQKNKMQSFLADNKKSLKMSEIKALDFGVYFAIPSVTKKKGYALVKEALEAITKFMLENEFKTKEYCPLCGEVMENQKQITIDDGYPMTVDEACGAQYQQELEQVEKDYQNAPNNYLQGTIGAIGGGLIGAVVWILVGVFLNFVSGWIAFLIAFLAGLGYDKMKGKPNNMKIIVSSVVTLCLVIFSMFMIYVIIVAREMSNYGMTGNPFSVLFELMELDEEVKTGFITDLILGIVFGIIGIVISIVNMRKTLHKKVK